MKQRIQKLLGLLLAIAMVLGLSAPVLAIEVDTDVLFTVGEASADAGATDIAIPVTVAGSPAFTAIGLTFTFDTTALTLTSITRGAKIHPMSGELGVNLDTATLNFDWGGFAFEDGEIFILTFDVSQYAQSGNFEIGMSVSSKGWAASNPDDPDDPIRIITTENNFVSGEITVSGLNVAEVNDVEYATLSGALAAAIDASPATITILKDALVADINDRLVITSGTDITLDMNGKTIMSAVPGSPVDQSNKPVNDTVQSGLIEVQSNGELEIVDNSTNKGGSFVHDTGDLYTRFLINSGTVNMSDVSVRNFYDGIRDGSLFSGQATGTYGTISDCRFVATEIEGISNFQKAALNFGQASVDAVTCCVVEGYDVGNARSIVVGTYDDEGSLGLLEDCEFAGLMVISRKGTVGTIKDCTIVNTPAGDTFARGLAVDGRVDLVDGGYYEGVYDCINVGSSGSIGEIKSGTFEAWDQAVYNYGTIEEVSGGDFHVGYYNAYNNTGTTNLISGGTFRSDRYRALCNDGGYIGEISGGEFISGTAYYGVENKGGTIDVISGGLFTSDSYTTFRNGSQYSSQRAVINLISGGTFVNTKNSNAFSCVENNGHGSTVEKISGGTFIGTNSAAFGISGNDTLVTSISGGTFIGKTAGLSVKNNSIGSISGGVFYGQDVAVKLDGETDQHEAHITDLAGGYFKTLGENGLIVAFAESSWASVDGYNFATVPTRPDDMDFQLPEDLPEGFIEELLIQDRTDFYHFGEAIEVTWSVDSQEDKDIFIKGDPVYYPDDDPEKENHLFRGWNAGGTLYSPQDPLPVALAEVTYLAEFLELGSASDYEVALAFSTGQNEHVNQGEDFYVDLMIGSENNEIFYGATIELTYNNKLIDETSIEGLPNNNSFGIVKTSDGDLTTLKFTGAAPGGYAMAGHSFKLATITFKAEEGVESQTTNIHIVDEPVVDQQYAVDDVPVSAGEDLEVNLWNIQVTFKAGDHVTMDETKAYVKYDEAGLYQTISYGDQFVEPQPEASDHYVLDTPHWLLVGGEREAFTIINGKAFTTDATYLATASGRQYAFTDTMEALVNITGVEDGKVTHGQNVTFKVKAKMGYEVAEVRCKIGEADFLTIQAEEGVYTIPEDEITGDVIIEVSYLVDGVISFIFKDDGFNSLPTGYKLLVYTVDEAMEEAAFEYGGELMFYSTKYSESVSKHVYVYMVDADVDEEAIRAGIQINPDKINVSLTYGFDVNGNGKVNSTDAVLTYGLFNGLHDDDTDFIRVSMRMRLEADVNGDKKVDTQDAQGILFHIWGVTP